MNEFDDNELNDEIGKLLRLKKFEQPPPGYFENFVHEFHRRQRDELLRQPIWSVLWQRFSASLFRFNIPSLTSYPAAATAVLVCAAVISFKIYTSPKAETYAHADHKSVTEVVPIPTNSTEPVDRFTFDSPVRLTSRSLGPDLSRQMINQRAYTHRGSTPPRYVLDRLPVSYEPSSFNF